jgi:hypothetical protein
MAQWSAPVVIPNQTSKDSPSLAVINGGLHLLHLGESSNNIWHSVYNGASWSPNQPTGSQSHGFVAFAGGAGGGLAIFQDINKEGDGTYGLIYSQYLPGWTRASRLPAPEPPTYGFTSEVPPALVLTPSGWLMVRVARINKTLAYATYVSSGQGVQLVESGLLPQRSKATPALAQEGYATHMAHLGATSNDIWYSPHVTADNVRVPNQTSKASPAMAVYNRIPHMVHLGDSSNNIWHSTYGNGMWSANTQIPNQSSSSPPALAANTDGLHMVYKGDSSTRLYHSIYR